MLSKLHLKYRILLGFILVSSFSLIVGGIGYFYLQKVVGKYSHVVTINMGNLEKMGHMKDAAQDVESRIEFIIAFPKKEAEVKSSLASIEKSYINYAKADKYYNDIPFALGEDAVYKKVNDNWKKLKSKTEELIALFKGEGSSEKVLNLYFTDFRQASESYLKSIDELVEFQNTESQKWSKESSDIAAFSTKLALVVMCVGFFVSVTIGSLLVKTLTGQLASVISELNSTTPQLTESASSMSALSSELSSCATEQASAVQETASSLEEISAMIKRNSDNANNAKTSSGASLQSVKNGQQAVANMLGAMEEINKNNDSFNEFMSKNNEELSEMVKVITNISDKTKVINDIVFQTKLLSFNASVEAARAGEQGKGFAVVAEEVGNLAQMSGNAANEIKGLLEESIVKVNQIVTSTKTRVEKLVVDGKEKIESGVARARDCDAALSQINDTVSSVESLVNEVAHASGEQSQGIQEVNKAMGQIDEVTNQNSIASQSVSSNAAQVMQLSQSIKVTSDKLLALLSGGADLSRELKAAKTLNEKKMKNLSAEDKEKVVPIKKAAAKKAVANKSAAPKTTVAASAPKKAVNESVTPIAPKKKGTEVNPLPSYDDSRFEDV